MAHIGPHAVIDPTAYVHESVWIYGKVSIGADVSVWPNAVIRAEMHEVRIGAGTNIQDFVMVHIGFAHPVHVGKLCSITHHATLHGCTIGDRTLIGINATVMDGARIGANSVVAGHCIVPENAEFPDNVVIAGVPAKVVAERDCSRTNLQNAEFYRLNGKQYAEGRDRFDADALRGVLGTP